MIAPKPQPKVVREGIYEFKEGNATYCGQSCDIPRRLEEHIRSGKLTPENVSSVKVTEVLGDKTVREIAEFRRIREITGGVPAKRSSLVTNKLDPIGAARQRRLNLDNMGNALPPSPTPPAAPTP